MGKKPIVSVTYENERISIKKQLTLKICVTSLLCGPRADLWQCYGFLYKRFSVYIKVYLLIYIERCSYFEPGPPMGQLQLLFPHFKDGRFSLVSSL